MERIVFAYSGDLEGSVGIPWLREHSHAEIVAVTMDLGQGRQLETVRDRALAVGAVRAHVLDLREEFARDFIVPALEADALYDDRSPMTAALSRPLIAKKLVEIAEIEQAQAVAHGGGAGGRRVALDVLTRALNPKLKSLAPTRDWTLSRSEVVETARRYGVRVPADAGDGYRVDLNLWGRAIEYRGEYRALDDELPEDVYALTKAARECPDEPAYVEIALDHGVPSAINGVAMPLLELIGSLGTIASAHGVGRIDVVEHRVGPLKLREVGEAPAAVLLHAAHRELRKMGAPRELEKFSRTVSAEYADIIYGGLWFSPLRTALAAYVSSVQDRVTGLVRFKLFKGAYSVVGRHAHTGPLKKPAIIPVTKG